MNPFQSIRDYEELIYTLKSKYPSIQRSSLIVIGRGKQTALVQGEVGFCKSYRIAVRERLSFDNDQVVIESYGYELWHGEEKVAWYDSQPHPHDSKLASTFPDHKHVQPNIKRNRIPAPDMSFDKPNAA